MKQRNWENIWSYIYGLFRFIVDSFILSLLFIAAEFSAGSEVEMTDILKNLHRLHDYNVMLREKIIANQSLLHALASKSTSLTNSWT